MKLRVRGNSIRLRLTKGEVDELAADGRVKESVDFGAPNTAFTYAVETVPHDGPVFAEYNGSILRVCISAGEVKAWAASDTVGIGGGDGLRILVEKDFACLTSRSGEDESDMFENPGNTECP